MSRFDGMRFGVREPGRSLLETYLDTRGQHLGMEVKRRILLGAYALSSGYYDAYYKKAKQVQTLIRSAYQTALVGVDAILTPTTPTVAFKIGEKTNDPLAMYLGDLFTVGANVSGLPAVSFPSAASGVLPVGVHLTGKSFSESTLFAIVKAYEQAIHD
jgi:aspartyl-tRNA(Asn)/glutamyl-tRNA(Gln) amidotransferase subunit A